MPSDEEKETAGQEKAENETAEQELVDLGSAGAEPEAGAAEQESAEEPEEEETAAGKKEKKFWLLSLGLILLLLVGGGFYAVTGMRQAAHKLGGGSDYDQLSANSSIYDGGAGAARNADYFPLDEDAARAQAAKAAGGGRINAALIRTQAELVAEANGKRVEQGAAAAQEEASSEERAAGTSAPAGQAAMAEKLQARASLSGGAMGSRSAKGSQAASAGGTGAFQGNGTVVGRATAQRETKSSTPKGAGRGSVMEGLKSAFKASFYGARLSSQDSAKGWIARSFDGTAEATTAIEYEDKMRSKLDKVNPDSIPGFLREQDVSAAEAKTLTTSEVAKPKMDKEGTKEALAEDKAYQAKKLAKDFSGSMINGLFAGLNGDGPTDDDKGGPTDDDKGGPGGDDPGDMDLFFADPDDVQEITDGELQEWVDTNGFGGECGCTEEAPCCCLPNSGAGDAGAGDANIWAGPDVGDFSGDTAFA